MSRVQNGGKGAPFPCLLCWIFHTTTLALRCLVSASIESRILLTGFFNKSIPGLCILLSNISSAVLLGVCLPHWQHSAVITSAIYEQVKLGKG